MSTPGPGRPGVAAILALSGGRRWGWWRGGLSHSPGVALTSGPASPGRAAAPAALPRKLDPRCFLTRQPPYPQEARGTPRETQRIRYTSPQDGSRHHRDSPRRAPSPTRKKTRRMGAALGRSEQAQGAATQCAGVNRNSARELEAGRGVVLEYRRRVAGVRRRTSQAAVLAAAWSGSPAYSRSAYGQAPPSGASCATRSRGTATWRPVLVAAEQ